jgi:hypothetical protein
LYGIRSSLEIIKPKQFKTTKLALELLQNEQTLVEIASKNNILPQKIPSNLKLQKTNEHLLYSDLFVMFVGYYIILGAFDSFLGVLIVVNNIEHIARNIYLVNATLLTSLVYYFFNSNNLTIENALLIVYIDHMACLVILALYVYKKYKT